MPKVAFAGPTYTSRSLNFSADRTVNLYPVASETDTSKSKIALAATPGLLPFCNLGISRVRGGTVALNRAFKVAANKLFELFSDGSKIERGTLNTSSGFVSIADNGRQICIVDGPFGYIFALDTGVFTRITAPYFTGANNVVFIDGYFMFNRPNTQVYYISSLYDGLNGDPLDFASAEGLSDNIVGICNVHQQVWLFGSASIEIVADTGDVDFPFGRISGAFIEYGCAAANSIANTANTVFWLGQDAYGSGVVWMANGYQPQRISTYAVEYAIQQYGNISDAIAYTYQEDGHYFYVLNFTNANTTWVYDVGIGMWHERASFENGMFARGRPQTHIFAFGKHLVGDYMTGNVYVQSLNAFNENGKVIRRMRTAPHINNGMNYLFHSRFQLDMETGVGNNLIADPLVSLSWSDDGGHKYSSEITRSLGKIGSYKHRVFWNRMGRSRDRIYNVVITADCKVFIIDAYIEASAGAN